jgi:Domain of unknown function (DUF397)
MVERSERRGAEPELAWRKSSTSQTENCYEIAFSDRAVLVRDSKNRSGATLTFSRGEWTEFVRMVSH